MAGRGGTVGRPCVTPTTPTGLDISGRFGPAVRIWTVLVAGALLADWWLIRQGHPTLSAAARTPAGMACRMLLEAHFQDGLGRFDPFRLVAR